MNYSSKIRHFPTINQIINYALVIIALFFSSRLTSELRNLGIIRGLHITNRDKILPTLLLVVIAICFFFFYKYKKQRSPMKDKIHFISIYSVILIGLLPYGYMKYAVQYGSFQSWIYHVIVCLLFILWTLFFLFTEYKKLPKSSKKHTFGFYIIIFLSLLPYILFLDGREYVESWIVNDFIHLFVWLLLASIGAIIHYVFFNREDDDTRFSNHT